MHLIKLACTFFSTTTNLIKHFSILISSGFMAAASKVVLQHWTQLQRICICILGRRSVVFFFTFFSGDDDATACGSMWLLEPRCWGLGGGEELQMIAA